MKITTMRTKMMTTLKNGRKKITCKGKTMKASEDLLSDVLKRIVVSVKHESENLVISYAFETENGKRKTHQVNKIILANKCKLWAIENGFAIVSGFINAYKKEVKICAEVFRLIDFKNVVFYAYAKTEEDAIISVCEWLKQTKCQ